MASKQMTLLHTVLHLHSFIGTGPQQGWCRTANGCGRHLSVCRPWEYQPLAAGRLLGAAHAARHAQLNSCWLSLDVDGLRDGRSSRRLLSLLCLQANLLVLLLLLLCCSAGCPRGKEVA